MKSLLQAIIIGLLLSVQIFPQTIRDVFKSETNINRAIPTFEEVNGIKLGSKPSHYFQTVRYIKAIARASDRVKLIQNGETFQGRKLYYLIVSSPENIAGLKKIERNISKLFDPRKIKSESDAKRIINKTPAIVFLMYSIHGNEASGTDASLRTLYTLAAREDSTIKKILDSLVICIYPMENPDGRERFISEAEQWIGAKPSTDAQSLPHSGLWPSGRTNHYRFDLNRDWFILSQPESRARVKAILETKPQLVIDAHEMGPYSTYLFNPPREPINPNMHPFIRHWWKIFSEDLAYAFDIHGWSYYTREWLDEFYPGYGTSWPSYTGAVCILYEQARTAGTAVKRPDKTILTFGESVRHQFVSSMTNIFTAFKNRKRLLEEYYLMKKEAVDYNGKVKAFVVKPGTNKVLTNKFISRLLFQGIEVYKAREPFKIARTKGYLTKKIEPKTFPAGSFVIPLKQPLKPLVKAIMDFDVRMKTSFLKSERESLLKGKGTRMYEVSAWSFPIAYGIDCREIFSLPKTELKKITDVNSVSGKLLNENAKYGYLIRPESLNYFKLLKDLFAAGFRVRCAKKNFTVEGKSYKQGTLLIRKIENPEKDFALLKNLALKERVEIIGVNTALSTKGIDLGGEYFQLLHSPKIALITGRSVSSSNFGEIWFLLDRQLKQEISLLPFERLRGTDLRKYNLIILPSVYGGVNSLRRTLGKSGVAELKSWTKNGGTLIAIGQSAAALADTSLKFSSVRLRIQSLKQLKKYNEEIEFEKKLKKVRIDSVKIWEDGVQKVTVKEAKNKTMKISLRDEKEKLKFMPIGVILKLKLNSDNWLCYGSAKEIPAFYSSRNVFLSARPVETAARIAGAKEMRISGLLWPEAKMRLSNAAYLTRESYGNGQIILFADAPFFRAYFYSTVRLLLNAIYLGPGMGARLPVDL